jgi:hypothetical protein
VTNISFFREMDYETRSQRIRKEKRHAAWFSRRCSCGWSSRNWRYWKCKNKNLNNSPKIIMSFEDWNFDLEEEIAAQVEMQHMKSHRDGFGLERVGEVALDCKEPLDQNDGDYGTGNSSQFFNFLFINCEINI